jgi:hypothetical protein
MRTGAVETERLYASSRRPTEMYCEEIKTNHTLHEVQLRGQDAEGIAGVPATMYTILRCQ